MALPRSEEKRIALLESAAAIMAAQGLGASTASIARGAGVAEGTLFRYFATKDVLYNALYTHLKLDLAAALRQHMAVHDSLDEQVRALWDAYIDWGVSNLSFFKTLNQLVVSDKVTAETRSTVASQLSDIKCIAQACSDNNGLAALPGGFADAVFMALAETTIQFVVRDPANGQAYKSAGFRVFWSGSVR
ncbi:TetR/AcrR family transcriptional regulator [Aquitalea magnusonii]|uniref:TetR family transcriptional regulator n=1 Tax=Aquitalea magnusonii TaxID=332411 RepID=A0A318JHY4_9NEIS|nr:TetR/AcrR family transcriptional regulator [Aquitalea magnusonii]PXX50414.1 TetR family transcriptional regulator [Aquitalea magnusonii]